MKMTLRPEQREAVERMAAEPTRATLLGAETGTGKTLMTVETVKALGAQTVLVIAPLNTQDGWKKTFVVQDTEHEFRKIDAKTPENFALLKSGVPGVYFVGREFFALSASSTPDTDDKPGRKARWSWSQVKPDVAVFDECFVAGTPVMTPDGPRPIESIREGDIVLGYDHDCGRLTESVVTGTMSRTTSEVMPNGATPNHPYYVVGDGYRPLADLTKEDQVVKITEDRTGVQAVSAAVLSVPEQPGSTLLREGVFFEVSRYAEGRASSIPRHAENGGRASEDVRSLQGTMGDYGSARESFESNAGIESREGPVGRSQGHADEEGSGRNVRTSDRREWSDFGGRISTVRRLGCRLAALLRRGHRRRGVISGVGEVLQDRLGFSRDPARGRVRRGVSSKCGSTGEGRKEDHLFGKPGVDNLAILEPRNSERYTRVREENRVCNEVTVYNLETSTTNYFANETLVHNCQTAANRQSNTFKVLKTLKPGYKIAASATPQGNKFENLWSISTWLWPATTDRSFWRWVAEWGTTEFNPHNQSKQKITGERVPGAYVKTLPCYVRLEADRVPEIKRKCYIDLTPSQRVMYDEMERDALTWLEENPLVADIPIVKRIRLRQIGLGEVTFNSKGEVDFEIGCRSGKIDALHKIVALHPDQPMLILLDSAKFVKVIVDALGPGAVPWTGDTKPGDRARYKAEFGKSVKYIVATIPAIGEGTDGLQLKCHIEVWFNKSTNNMKNEQAAGRLNRGGQPSEVIYSYELLARGTDDDGQFEKLKAQTIANRKTLTV